MKYHHGFSLLELLVVLLFMALLASVLFPQLVKTREASQFNTNKLSFIHAIQSLPFFCLNHAIAARIDSFPVQQGALKEVLKVPSEWNIEVLSPIVISQHGLCQGGKLKVKVRQRQFMFNVSSPLCKVDVTVFTPATPAT